MTFKDFKANSLAYFERCFKDTRERELEVVVLKENKKHPFELIVTDKLRTPLFHFTEDENGNLTAQTYNAQTFVQFDGKNWW